MKSFTSELLSSVEENKRGIAIYRQKAFEVYYQDELIGTLVPDLIVEDDLVVDAKVASAFNESYMAQMLGSLNITVIETGFLLNFKFSKLGIKRVRAFNQ